MEFDRSVYRSIPKSLLVLKPLPEGRTLLGQFLGGLGDRPVQLSVTLRTRKTDKSLDQLALLWWTYELEANEENQGIPPGEPGTVTKEEVYERDLREHAPRVTMLVRVTELAAALALLDHPPLSIRDEGEMMEITGVVGARHWDVWQMARWLDMRFNRLAAMDLGIGSAADVAEYWRRWRKGLNRRKIILHDEMMTEEEYRARQVVCEGCGRSLVQGGGLLAHISTRGSGVTWAAQKAHPGDWLLLCPDCELYGKEAFHTVGVERFIKSRPWLRYKVLRALGRAKEKTGGKENEQDHK